MHTFTNYINSNIYICTWIYIPDICVYIYINMLYIYIYRYNNYWLLNKHIYTFIKKSINKYANPSIPKYRRREGLAFTS